MCIFSFSFKREANLFMSNFLLLKAKNVIINNDNNNVFSKQLLNLLYY